MIAALEGTAAPSATSASFPEMRNLKEVSYHLSFPGVASRLRSLFAGIQPAGSTDHRHFPQLTVGYFPRISFSPRVQKFSFQVADVLVKTARA